MYYLLLLTILPILYYYPDILYYIGTLSIYIFMYILYEKKQNERNIKNKLSFKIKVINDNVKEYYMSKYKTYNGDSGLDLPLTSDIIVPAKAIGFPINLGIICAPNEQYGYYLYPRSSISKTSLRLSNSVGIIDAGYRGEIIAKVDNISDYDVKLSLFEDDGLKETRLFQLCNYELSPFKFTLVNTLDETERGSKGFGSTSVTK